jgi:tRNA (cmo5U34)-methyltransferase
MVYIFLNQGYYMKDQDNITPHKSYQYDAQIDDTIPYYCNFHTETIKLVKSLRDEPKKWLDTGCGTGSLVEKASEVFHYTNFLLLDPSEAMLDQAKKKLAKVDEERLTFLEPSTTQDFPGKLGEKPEVITAIQCHHYLSMKDRIKATKNCYNLLKEDGIYITFENIKPLTSEGIEIGKRYWEIFQLNRGRDYKTVKNHLDRFDVEYFPINIEEHLKLLRRTGFKAVELMWFSYMQAGFYCLK